MSANENQKKIPTLAPKGIESVIPNPSLRTKPEIVAGKISFTDERTFYTKYGDIFGWIIVGLMLVLIGYNSYLKKTFFGIKAGYILRIHHIKPCDAAITP